MQNRNVLAITKFNPSELVFLSSNNHLVTDSITVSRCFNKLHKDVLRKIESLDCSDVFASAHFYAHVQKLNIGNAAVRDSKYYQMTKDGFMFLVMGFTGKRAATIKEAYINAFNLMAKKMRQPSPPLTHRTLTLFENGHPIESKLIPNDAFVITKSSIPTLIEENSVFNVDELLEIAASVNKKIAQLAKH
ncbi:TPA: Rha family transcriptional regulator [Photobacterium damselae]